MVDDCGRSLVILIANAMCRLEDLQFEKGMNPKTAYLDGGDARHPLLDTKPLFMHTNSGPSAPTLPSPGISTPLLSNEYQAPVKPDARWAGPSYQVGHRYSDVHIWFQ
jgi:hypothetical protein